MNYFVKDNENYKRDLNIVNNYIRDQAKYLSLMTDESIEICESFVKRKISSGEEFALYDPDVICFIKNKYGDRVKKTIKFSDFLKSTMEKDYLLSPNLTLYIPKKKKQSLIAIYITYNKKLRNVAKKEMFEAENNVSYLTSRLNSNNNEENIEEIKKQIEVFKVIASNKSNQQKSRKIKNNAVSGGQSSPFTPLWNKTAHSTLTSVCRTATSFANSNNERFLSGNRHYWIPDIVKANIISIINNSDYDLISNAIKKYNLITPNTEQVMECIRESTKNYWVNSEQMNAICFLVEKLNPLEKAAFLFTNDFFYLRKVNNDFAYKFIRSLACLNKDFDVNEIEKMTIEDADYWLSQADDHLMALIGILRSKEFNFDKIKNIRKNIDERKNDYIKIALTVKQILTQLSFYSDFIKAFWVTENIPQSVYCLPNIVRKSVMISDTDSTIFTVMEWVKWFFGNLNFNDETISVANVIVFFTGQMIKHLLAQLSSNAGVDRVDLNKLSMKNEFFFPVLVLTSKAKHYFGDIAAQEGVFYSKNKREVKGLSLRNSKVQKNITLRSKQLMIDIATDLQNNKKLSIVKILSDISNIEKEIYNSLNKGNFDLLNKEMVNEKESYKNPFSSNYIYYTLWNDVFAAKYGYLDPPPYSGIKVPLTTFNKTKFSEWLESIEDKELSERFKLWCMKYEKTKLNIVILPQSILSISGIPKEIIMVADHRDLTIKIMESFYLILESLGIYLKNENTTKLVSDFNFN